MSRHVFVLTYETISLTGAVNCRIGTVRLPEVRVETILETSCRWIVGKENSWCQWASQSTSS